MTAYDLLVLMTLRQEHIIMLGYGKDFQPTPRGGEQNIRVTFGKGPETHSYYRIWKNGKVDELRKGE
jgi:hypothetical protein